MTKLEDKITSLEEKLAYQEDAIHKLDTVVSKQYDVIDGLKLRIKQLEEKMESLQGELDKRPMSVDTADEKPPHY